MNCSVAARINTPWSQSKRWLPRSSVSVLWSNKFTHSWCVHVHFSAEQLLSWKNMPNMKHINVSEHTWVNILCVWLVIYLASALGDTSTFILPTYTSLHRVQKWGSCTAYTPSNWLTWKNMTELYVCGKLKLSIAYGVIKYVKLVI